MLMIDLVILFRYLIQIGEMHWYAADYPQSVEIEVIVKTILVVIIILVEGIFIIKLKYYDACKLAYALKLCQILFVIICAILYTDTIQEECALWLKNPEHKFKRNSEDTNTHRPFT